MGYLYDITFIFGRCHHSWGVETHDRHEHDLKYLSYTFVKSKIPVTDKLKDEAL